jgi:hypothetical protein
MIDIKDTRFKANNKKRFTYNLKIFEAFVSEFQNKNIGLQAIFTFYFLFFIKNLTIDVLARNV